VLFYAVGEEWTGNDGRHLVDPWPDREPVHGATSQLGIRPVMLEVDGRQLRVTRYIDRWSIFEKAGGYVSSAWEVELDDGRQVVALHWHNERWLLAR
jgi:hypothetical protein